MKKIAVIDLDDTLLKSDKTISEFTKTTLDNWQNNGNFIWNNSWNNDGYRIKNETNQVNGGI